MGYGAADRCEIRVPSVFSCCELSSTHGASCLVSTVSCCVSSESLLWAAADVRPGEVAGETEDRPVVCPESLKRFSEFLS